MTWTDGAPSAMGDPTRYPAPDALVIGGGVIGLAIAWRAALAGVQVSVVDPQPTAGASWAAAGMLAPVTEVAYGEEPLLALNLASARRYPSFVAELEQASEMPVGYRETGTLAVAVDADDRAALTELHGYQQRLGLEAKALTGREARELEPMLTPAVRGGLLVAGDHSVDNRLLGAALLVAAERAGVTLHRDRAAELTVAGDRVTAVRLAGGQTLPAGTVVLAAGCWSAQLAGVPVDAVPPVRPVKGQVVRLRGPQVLSRNLRAEVRGSHIYLVPRADGELVIGATVEEQGFDTRVRAGGVYQLLRDAHEVLPVIDELELTESYAGLRPGSPDNAPLLGPTRLPGLVLATGHYRNGILLTPVTADAIAGYLSDGQLPAVAQPFSPQRFAAVPA